MTEKELMRTFRFFNFKETKRGPRFDASIARVDARTRARGTLANTRVWGSANIYIMIFSIFIW